MHRLIDHWLYERQQLVQAFDALNSIQAPTPNAEELQHFYQLLLDYVSVGHFEVCEQLTVEGKASGGWCGLELARQISPRLETITESVLSFSDRYDNGDCRGGAYLIAELRVLWQQLHGRFELGGCLIEILYSAHSQSGAEGSAVSV